jgi:hypothetical protein
MTCALRFSSLHRFFIPDPMTNQKDFIQLLIAVLGILFVVWCTSTLTVFEGSKEENPIIRQCQHLFFQEKM